MIAISVIAIYSRKSKFTGKGESIQNQVELCKEYAAKNYDVKKFLIFEDEGYSGSNTNRPRYKEMLEKAIFHKFDVLICYRLDRISRNISDFTSLVELLSENNIDFISIRESFDTSTPMGRAMMFIASVFSQLERETISERVKDNMYSLAKSGRWLGGKTPMGFISEQVEYFDNVSSKRKLYKLSPKPSELKLVTTLYNKYLELGSLTALEVWAKKNDIKTRSSKLFDKSILKFILSNPVYAVADPSMYNYFSLLNSKISNYKEDFDGKKGLMVYNRHEEKKNRVIKKDPSQWIVAVGLHPGTIPSETWIEVQNLLRENRKKAPRSGTGKIGLVTDLLRCKNCGSKMRISVSRSNNKIYYYYKCLTKERSKGVDCNINNINGRIADNLIISEIAKISSYKQNLYLHLCNEFKEMRKMLEPKFNKDELQKEIKVYEGYINNLTLRLSQLEYSNTGKYIIEQIEAFDEKILELRGQLEIQDDSIKPSENLKTISNEILNLINIIDTLNFDEKKRFIRSLVEKIIWDGNLLEIKLSSSTL
ncbi:recombinase family protein [Wukongibacter baidiensis]|uniref:recombinase family protein n=1 Tax=Wukongibacter baidiensis TaxID=1723361 RepID=UPI003D7F2A49